MRLIAWCAVVLGLVSGIASASEGELPWDKQFSELGYHILYTSSINLINGLQLTLDQATRLHQLAADVEKASQKPPPNAGSFGARLQPARSAYRDLEEILLKGEEVPQELAARMHSGRAAESAEVRASLAHSPAKQGCAKCHSNPAERGPAAKALDRTDFVEREMGVAHMTGPYGGTAGFMQAMRTSSDIEKILTPSQLSLVSDFSCCITPPKNLKDPARVGQAAVSEERLTLLRGVRRIPESIWSTSRATILKKTGDILAMAFPGMPDSEKKLHGERAGQILDKARALSDVDFEMQKEELAKALDQREARREKASNVVNPAHHAATFLMLPGSTRAYDALTGRLKSAQTAGTAQVDLKNIQGAENCQDGHCALKNGGNIKPGQ